MEDSSSKAPEEAANCDGGDGGDGGELTNRKGESPFWTWMGFLGMLCALGLLVWIFTGGAVEDGPLAMPAAVRQHFAAGRSIKVEVGGGVGSRVRSVKVFVRSEGPVDGEAVILLHGMGASSFIYRKVMPLLAGSGIRTIAIDFPGSGLSDKFTLEEWKHEAGGIEKQVMKVKQVVREIVEKGLFWRMEQLFNTGSLPEEHPEQETVDIVEWPIGAFPEESAEALTQVLDSLGEQQVHLVFHDTASEAARVWTLRHPARVRSVTMIDTQPAKPSLPVLALGAPGIGSLLLSSGFLLSLLLKSCCIRAASESAAAHAFLMKTGRGRQALYEMARMANASHDLGQWKQVSSSLPMQLLWSQSWSEEWKQEGLRASSLLPGATMVPHHGSRWPQEDGPEEVAASIHRLVSSLAPGQNPRVKEEVPAHIQEMFDRMEDDGHEQHGHGGCSHAAHQQHHAGWGLYS